MAVAIISGSNGLVGSESTRHFARLGMDVVGIDNDLRATFFGTGASTAWQCKSLQQDLGSRYRHNDCDIRDESAIDQIFGYYGNQVGLVIHTAAQPSHDWAARDPIVDFTVNANGTLVLLEAVRKHAPNAVFIFTSTNKVYGDRPNVLPFIELSTRWEIDPEHKYASGISEDMPIDATMHSVFGASKVAADIMVQEYGRYFGLRTACFRGGCLTGPNHSGAQLHGFLAYLMKCTVEHRDYEVFGYNGKQVRDNIHSADLVAAFEAFYRAPRFGEVYNIGGGRASNCSMLEAIDLCQKIAGESLSWTYNNKNRRGDHRWWISDLAKFRSDYPDWRIQFDVPKILEEIHQAVCDRNRKAAAVD